MVGAGEANFAQGEETRHCNGIELTALVDDALKNGAVDLHRYLSSRSMLLRSDSDELKLLCHACQKQSTSKLRTERQEHVDQSNPLPCVENRLLCGSAVALQKRLAAYGNNLVVRSRWLAFPGAE